MILSLCLGRCLVEKMHIKIEGLICEVRVLEVAISVDKIHNQSSVRADLAVVYKIFGQ